MPARKTSEKREAQRLIIWKPPRKLTFRGRSKVASNIKKVLSVCTFMGKLSPPELPLTGMLPLGRGVEG